MNMRRAPDPATRSLALGVCDSIEFATGYRPVTHKPRALATLGAYALFLFVVGASLALAAH